MYWERSNILQSLFQRIDRLLPIHDGEKQIKGIKATGETSSMSILPATQEVL